MKIGIVEDEAVWGDKIQTIIEKYCRGKNISSQINSYDSGKDSVKESRGQPINGTLKQAIIG